MKRFLKILGIAAIALAVLAVIAVAAVFAIFPRVRPVTSEKFERTPARVARGRYLVHHVSDCLGCHSERLLDRFAMPTKPGAEAAGGLNFSEGGMRLYTANITPDVQTGIGSWSDDEIVRAVREGIRRNGDPLFPAMPYGLFAQMSDEDARSVVAYLRTLPPSHHPIPERHLPVPLNAIVRLIPKPLEGHVASVDPKNTVAYGKYLTTIGGCVFCHTPKDGHNDIPGMQFAGGFEMQTPTGRVVSANITPDPQTFVGKATRDEFIEHFKSLESIDATNAPVVPKGRNTVMPWLAYSGMTREDLGAIYDYLHSLPPVHHVVNSFPDAQ